MDKRVILFVAVFFAIIAVNSVTALPTAEQPWSRYFDEGESMDPVKRGCRDRYHSMCRMNRYKMICNMRSNPSYAFVRSRCQKTCGSCR
ncbi:hypothetical protein OS493_009449 [Desmophyllum pertusum]|uniref:ShKT domain-containing protein n=1 Tax=Desmophyllum pertusum TaxID=174260 RepID=A0A9X0CS77_9CNID|nr:hypothetical protein OS493_009449 [Desmophyllum pertusum]